MLQEVEQLVRSRGNTLQQQQEVTPDNREEAGMENVVLLRMLHAEGGSQFISITIESDRERRKVPC